MSELLKLIDDKKPSGFEEFIKRAPLLAIIFANIGVAFGEYRVYDIVNQITHSPWKAVGAILSTGIPFLLWEVLWQYRIASTFQKVLAILMAALAFFTATYLGVEDFLFGITSLPTDAILRVIVLALAAHVLAGLLFFYLDPSVSAKRKKAEMEEKYQQQNDRIVLANGLLLKAETMLASKQSLAKRYGKREVEAILKQLAGDGSVPTEEVSVGSPSNPGSNGKATKEEVLESVPTHSFR